PVSTGSLVCRNGAGILLWRTASKAGCTKVYSAAGHCAHSGFCHPSQHECVWESSGAAGWSNFRRFSGSANPGEDGDIVSGHGKIPAILAVSPDDNRAFFHPVVGAPEVRAARVGNTRRGIWQSA